ncbi:hypothetical protein [Dyella sp. Tek66A03]|uniref:hypothetical protein n=1 Tax=Dyella sp. Tek66A03 TaxID=3458298 RepID=UPI00403E3A78
MDKTDQFIALAGEVVSELEGAIVSGDIRYNNAAIAIENVRRWRDLAIQGSLWNAYGPTLGVSKSDLTFGPVDGRMHELEELFVQATSAAG